MKGQIGTLCYKAEPVWYVVGIAITQPAFQGRAHHKDQKSVLAAHSDFNQVSFASL